MACTRSNDDPRLERLLERLEAWRGGDRSGRRIPEQLWREAVPLARVHGVCRVSRALRLNYDGLKKRVEEEPTATRRVERDDAGLGGLKKRVRAEPAATFVEFGVPTVRSEGECVLELEDVHGTKMTVRLSDPRSVDVVALANVFLGRAR